MKEYALPNLPVEDKAKIKTSALMSEEGDYFYAAPGVIVVFWVDIPGALSYSYEWDLGNGQTSTEKSAEGIYDEGEYLIKVTLTKKGEAPITLTINLSISRDYSWEQTIVLLSSQKEDGIWTYELGLNTRAIYNYNGSSATPWYQGDFSGWEKINIENTITQNDIEYLVFEISTAQAERLEKFTFGRGSNYAFATQSIYWVSSGPGEGLFHIYLKEGSMLYNPSSSSLIPGDFGDEGENPVVRYGYTNINNSGSQIELFINYGTYANGANPFYIIYSPQGNEEPKELEKLPVPYLGWGKISLDLSEIGQLWLRFGKEISDPGSFGNMSSSKYYLPLENMLAFQVVGLHGIYSMLSYTELEMSGRIK